MIAIVAAVFFYRRLTIKAQAVRSPRRSASRRDPQLIRRLQEQRLASASRSSSPQQPAGSPSQPPAGFGAIRIANLKTRTVEVYDQNSSGEQFLAAGYAGSITPTTTTLQVPAGTYKLKFDNLFIEHVAVTSARSPEILLGTISLPNLTRTVEVYDQNSSGGNVTSSGYAGTISPTTTTLQVPAGTYKLKFDNLFVEHVAVTSARSPEILLGTISLPNLTRTAEVYDQNSSGGNYCRRRVRRDHLSDDDNATGSCRYLQAEV